MEIANDIAAKIASGEYAEEQRLPGEADLAEMYGTARMTVRRAIRELRERGLVHTVYGKGTYVLRPKRQAAARQPMTANLAARQVRAPRA